MSSKQFFQPQLRVAINPVCDRDTNTTTPVQISPISETATRPITFYAFLTLTFILFGRPQDVFLFLQPLRPGLVFAIINTILAINENKSISKAFIRESLGKKYLCFYFVMIFGIPFAIYRRGAFEFVVLQYCVNILYFGLFVININSYERMKSLSLTIVFSICIYGLASLHGGVSQGGRFAFGSMYDPNDLAYILVSLVPFTGIFFLGKEKIVLKLLVIFTLIISLILILATGSRGGLIGLSVLLLLLLFTKLSPLKRSIRIFFFIGIIILAMFNQNMLFTERNATILHLNKDYNTTSEEGRLNLWKKGVEFSLERPLTGVGANCFPNAIGVDRKHRGGQEVWQVVHNAYIQIASELGLVAFAIFMLMMKETLQVFQKVRRLSYGQMEIVNIQKLAGIVQICFICHFVVAFFLTQGYSILFTLFFAFAAATNKTLNNILGGKNVHSK